MKRPEGADLQSLAAAKGGHRLSLYVPLDNREPPRSPIHLKNLMDEARELLGRTLDEAQVEQMVAPLTALMADASELKGTGTIALFIEPDGERGRYRLEHTTNPKVVVDDHFYLRPLTEALNQTPFAVVCLSQKAVRIFASTPDNLVELEPADLPRRGIDDIPGADAEHNGLQHHTAGHRGPAIHHGHRDDTKGDNELLKRLCQATAQALLSQGDPQVPIVVAATERLAALFEHQADGLEVAGVINGHHVDTPLEQLHAEASKLMDTYIHTRDRDLRENLETAIAHGRGAKRLSEVLIAAFDGRVDTLFVDQSAQRWGTLDPGARRVVVHNQPREGDRDLIDMAVRLTLQHGGDVVPYMPIEDQKGLATIHRHG